MKGYAPVVAGLAIISALTACSSTHTRGDAIVTGRMYVSGGAPLLSATNSHYQRRPVPAGRVLLSSDNHTFTANIGAGGLYVAHVPAGHYSVKASTPYITIYMAPGRTLEFTCFADPFTLSAGRTRVVDLGCPVK